MTIKRIEMPPGEDPPDEGQILLGRRDHWRVTRAHPVESPKWPNSWRCTCEPLGAHGLTTKLRESYERRWPERYMRIDPLNGETAESLGWIPES